jgi:anti-anti-sigma factor
MQYRTVQRSSLPCMSMDLVARQTRIGLLQVLQLSGEADLATIPRLSDALTRLLAATDGRCVVDLDGITVFEDAALGLLLGATGRAVQSGTELVVVCSPGLLRDRLALTGFDRAVRVVDRLGALD